MTPTRTFIEHRIRAESGLIYARDYPGTDNAFVLMHGFPDNLRIYEDLIPHLCEAGRRVIAFDFLGFGASEKRAGALYSFEQQRADLKTVIDFFNLAEAILVPHDSSGIVALNFAIDHPQRVAALGILNSAFDESAATVWPEMVSLFAEPKMGALALAVAQSPAQFTWLLEWQREKFAAPLSPQQKAHFQTFMGPLIAENFTVQPGSGPAFMQMASQFYPELKRNSARLPLLRGLTMPVKVIWGANDPYLTVEMGEERASHFKNGTFHAVPAGHWVQSDEPQRVARELLS
jgi:haloalkane dehalogenase